MKLLNSIRYSSALPLALSMFASPFAQSSVTETRTTTVTETSVASAPTAFEPTRASSQTPYATNGLSNVISAETIGAGRMNVALRANFYKQDNNVINTVSPDAQVTTVSGAVALGLNEYLDAFGVLNIYNLRAGNNDGSGFGSSIIGAQASLPMSRSVPIRFGAQLAAIFGTSANQINNNALDGYAYLSNRDGNDFMVRLTQSLLMARDGGTGFNLHFNEGVISSLESGKDIALVTGIGLEVIPIHSLILGLEANSRTFLAEPAAEDPLWVTPSVTWRSPAFVNVNVGVDVALSPERSGQPTNSLEPWRIFGGLSYSIDTKKNEKRLAAERARQDSLQKAALTRQVLNSQQRNDSLARAKALSDARSQAAADSLRNKARQDSIAAANALNEERSKRSEMEKQLLTTGLLLLDAVYFETGKTQISINSEPYLNLIAKMLVKYPKLQIEIGGHTDNVGGQAYNQNLSQGRAQAVADYMVKSAPELQGRLTARGYAFSMPKADNKTAAGRQMNRRTELKVLNRDALKEYNP
jgi:outer membrane protein OmpA-like peptidoglycan-associated protein